MKKKALYAFQLWFELCKNIGIDYGQWKMKSISIGPEFYYFPKVVPVKDILASVEDGLQGIFPSETDLYGGKVVSTDRKKNRSRSVLTTTEHMTLQQFKVQGL